MTQNCFVEIFVLFQSCILNIEIADSIKTNNSKAIDKFVKTHSHLKLK